MLTFSNCNATPVDGKLLADDGTVLAPNDHVYLVCEPPGEPYYVGRIMEFLHIGNDASKPIDALRINWYYRPKDIGRRVQDTRLLFATMHSDISPLTALRVLDERWKFVLVEQGRGKELTSAMKLCKKCGAYCASNDSVDCSDCKLTYHMNCVTPPVTKKPSRGFGWSCAACSRKHEKKLHARNTPNILDPDGDFDEEEFNEEEEAIGTTQTGTPLLTRMTMLIFKGLPNRSTRPAYYDDRIYPRASSRIGPKHQANVLAWPGRPVIYEPVLEFKRAGKRDTKLSKENQAALEAQKLRRETRPKWVQDEPPAIRLEAKTTMLMTRTSSTNLQNIALVTLYSHDFDVEKALDALSKTDLDAFKEPNLTTAEQKKFEEAVMKYGSELHTITKHVKTLKHGDIVRHYYIWKKTERGKQIWGDYSGRKGRKEAKKAEEEANKLQEDLADDMDDSAFDSEKAIIRKKNFICKFCSTKSSRQWRRAPATASSSEGIPKASSKDRKEQYVVALCRRCAELWRRYGIQWEDIEEMAKKVAQAGGRAWKRKQDEELLKELIPAKDLPSLSPPAPEPAPAQVSASATNASHNGEPPRKKLKSSAEERISLNYKCVLCPIEYTEHDFVGYPKASSATGKKKSDKDRDREKSERDQAQKAADYHRKKQEETNRPVNPREPLKRTADNNWVHVTCAMWTPEVNFGSGEAMVPAEGIPSIPRSRFEEVCIVCNKAEGACVSCNHCRTPVHVECARQNDFVLGFDITPIKGSRRDQFHIVTVGGESGVMSAGLWCKDHAPTKTIIHHMHDLVGDDALNAIQFYSQNFKQADQTINDTVRKANLITAAAKSVGGAASTGSGGHQQRPCLSTVHLPSASRMNRGFRWTHRAWTAKYASLAVSTLARSGGLLTWIRMSRW
ncbi:unnamed protein product [Parascedosporium putredinis]|uniref:Uncharacterized protein n=1 Tax=Parascedosporium putredinis TaxID=1442378 RepID=A0A9P1H6Q8_9PEZI|nr:unnamed protein product [Parascedosporium putredinis]CAI7998223.1 unnamed protein product [Parascedosporium putredinis]